MVIMDSDLVVVAGANGHVTQHVVSQLLSSYPNTRVSGTIQSSIIAQKLQNTFKSPAIAEN